MTKKPDDGQPHEEDAELEIRDDELSDDDLSRVSGGVRKNPRAAQRSRRLATRDNPFNGRARAKSSR